MPTDREVLWLAIPALGALIAEPLYVLGDTAIIGHLGTVPLAGLALAGLLLSEIFGFCTFLEYGTTARAARLYGAGRVEEALDVGGSRQVVIAAPRHERLDSVAAHAVDEVGTEEPAAPGDQRAHPPRVASGTDGFGKPQHSPNTERAP